jgi:hypothetical protein
MRRTYLLDCEAAALLAPGSNKWLNITQGETWEMAAMRRGDLLDHVGGVGGFLLLRKWVVGQLSVPRT